MPRFLSAVVVFPLLLDTGAIAAPISVAQNGSRNVVTVIQQKNPLISIARDVSATDARGTVREITLIGPDPVPVAVRQLGAVNLLRAVQQGSQPMLDLIQDGASNRSRVHQLMIP